MTVTFEGEIHTRTGRAIRFQSYYWEAPLWFPLSQVEIFQDPDAPFEVVLVAKPWIAKVKNVYEFTHYTQEEIEKRDAQ
jgi:hypothetical protein